MRKSWDSFYYDIALRVSERSPCLSKKIGALLVRDKVVICQGFNGPARGIPPCGAERLKEDTFLSHRLTKTLDPVLGDSSWCPRRRLGYDSGKGLELCPAVHAEANCIAQAARLGIKTYGCSLYLTCGIPCKDCLSLIINAGIQEVVVTSMHYYDELTPFIEKMSILNLRIRTYKEDFCSGLLIRCREST